MADEDRIPNRFRGHFHNKQLAATVGHNIHDNISGLHQVGGTASFTAGEFVGRLAGKGGADKTGLGRYTWQRFNGKGGIILRIVTFYRPCRPTNGAGSVYSQQLAHFHKLGSYVCPRNAILVDLREDIEKWKQDGEQVILMGDLNEYVGENNVRTYFQQLGMRELITEKHGLQKCATTRGNKSKQAVDGIWGTMGIKIEAGGYLPFHTGIASDHRILWIKVVLSYIFGHTEQAMKKPVARNLRMDDEKGKHIYKKTTSTFLRAHQVKERLEELNHKATYPPTEEQCNEYEVLDKLRMQAREKGIKRCRKIYRSGVASHPKIKKLQLTIRLINLIIERRTAGAKIKWRTISNLAKKVDRRDLLELNTERLWAERTHSRKEYYKLKKTSGKLRSTLIEEKAKEQEKLGNSDEAQRLHNLLSNEKERERSDRLRRIKNQEMRTGVRSVKKERLVFDPGGNQESSGSFVTEEITGKINLEKACMEE
eukprot:15366810-Ditylum_brightwellii.AAC.1